MLYCIEKAHQSLLENPMAKKYGTYDEQTRIPTKTNYQKDIISLKGNANDRL